MLKRVAISATVLALTLTACGGDDDAADESAPADEPSSSEAAETEMVTVELRDGGSLDALYNGDGGKCTSKNFSDALALTIENPDASPEQIASMLPSVSVELANAEGTTIGLQELEQYGGGFEKATGCVWTIRFEDVEPSDFYEVTVNKGDEVVATEKAGVPTLVVTF